MKYQVIKFDGVYQFTHPYMYGGICTRYMSVWKCVVRQLATGPEAGGRFEPDLPLILDLLLNARVRIISSNPSLTHAIRCCSGTVTVVVRVIGIPPQPHHTIS